jgi:putative transposase
MVRYETNETVKRLLKDFQWMVNYAIEQGLKHGYSVRKLHELCYRFFADRFDYHTLYYPMAYRVAQSIIRTWKANKGKEKPQMVKKIVRVHKTLFKLDMENSILHLKVRRGEILQLKLKLSKWHKEWLRRGRNGEILINEEYVYIPITVQIDLTKPDKWVAIDINENNVAYVSSDGEAGKIVTGLKEVKTAYANKRRKIRLKAKNSKRCRELMRKYARREKNRTRDILHKLSKLLADKFKGYGFLLENLKGLRNSANKRVLRFNRFNRKIQAISVKDGFIKGRLNRMAFRKLQNYIEYKANLNTSPVHYLSPKNTSKFCFRCGGKINSLKYCPKCGLDRDINACLNLLKMWGVCVPPESLTYEAMKLPLTSGFKSHDEEKVAELREEVINNL